MNHDAQRRTVTLMLSREVMDDLESEADDAGSSVDEFVSYIVTAAFTGAQGPDEESMYEFVMSVKEDAEASNKRGEYGRQP